MQLGGLRGVAYTGQRMKIPSTVGAVFLSVSAYVTANTTITEEIFGKMPDGREVKIYTLENGKGMRVKVTEYGAILASVEAPDRAGKSAELTHGYDTLEGWLKDGNYFGATVGRFGNRIAGAEFTLDGKKYTLAANNSPGGLPCTLHGGKVGFNKVLWKGEKTPEGVVFSHVSKDGDEGFPGNLSVKVTYSLNEGNELRWTAEATTDAPTVVNLVQHVYWNLSGDATRPVTDQVLTLEADQYLPTNKGLIPTGERAPVADTPMDFTKPRVVGKSIDEDFPALKLAGGYDHAWVLRQGEGVRKAATLEDPASGRVLTISTDAPAVQLYTGNFLNGSTKGRGGVPYGKRTSLCLETEAFPDAPNQSSAPTTVLRPGETYQHHIVFKLAAH